MRECVCVCVCLSVRGRGSERVCVCLCVSECESERERDRASLCVFLCMCVTGALPKKLRSTGRNMRPCTMPSRVITRLSLKKKIRISWALANASTTIPGRFVMATPANTCRRKEKVSVLRTIITIYLGNVEVVQIIVSIYSMDETINVSVFVKKCMKISNDK